MHSVLSLLTDDQQALLSGLVEQLLAELSSPAGAEGRLCRLCDLEACGRRVGRCPVAPRRTRSAVL